jgi:hypothetical protein
MRGFAYLQGAWLPGVTGYVPAAVTAGGAGAQTVTSFTPLVNTWYTLHLIISMSFSSGLVTVADTTDITFTITDSTDTVVWTDTITPTTTGVPSADYIPGPAYPVKSQVSGWSTAGTNAPFLNLDYIITQVSNLVR